MPELPDITNYIEALGERIDGQLLQSISVQSLFVLRTAEPSIEETFSRRVRELRRVGKRIAIGLEGDYWLVLHLMIAGRLTWHDDPDKKVPRTALALFIFDSGQLVFTESGKKKRASLHILQGGNSLDAIDPRGLEILDCDLAQFSERLVRKNHTLKRALTDARLFSGIGNAYSDEILHAAQLSPIAMTQKLDAEEIKRLFTETVSTLSRWTARLRELRGDAFPKKVTAFRDGMSVHGRYQQPCPVCETPVQRIRYASNEVNYCPRCQTNGRILADRALSRLLKKDWPRTIEELESISLPRQTTHR